MTKPVRSARPVAAPAPGFHPKSTLTMVRISHIGIVAMIASIAAFAQAVRVRAEEPASSARPVPLTRPEMKEALEALKKIKLRIPLPELTEAEKEKLGERGGGYEGRVRALYMPGGEGRGGLGFGREADPKMSLSYEFKTRLFWIVSRTNNCHY